MCLGAYAAAWFTIPPVMKSVSLPGLPAFLLQTQLPIFVSAALAGTVRRALRAHCRAHPDAALRHRRLDRHFRHAGGDQRRLFELGFGDRRHRLDRRHPLLYRHLDGASAAPSSSSSSPISTRSRAPAWRLRAARDEATAAAASGIDIVRERLIAFVISAFVIGVAGALYAHFLGVVNPDAFYLGVTFITLVDAGGRRHEQPVGRGASASS